MTVDPPLGMFFLVSSQCISLCYLFNLILKFDKLVEEKQTNFGCYRDANNCNKPTIHYSYFIF